MDSWNTWCDYYNASPRAAEGFLNAWITQGQQALNRLPPRVRAAVLDIAANTSGQSFALAAKHSDCKGLELWQRVSQLRRSARSGGSVNLLSLDIAASNLTNTTGGATYSNCDAIIAAIEALERGEWPGDVLPAELQTQLQEWVADKMPSWMRDAWAERNEEAIADLLVELRAALEENCGSSGGAVFDPSDLQPGSDMVVPGTFPSGTSSISSSSSTASSGDNKKSWTDYALTAAGLVTAYATARKLISWLP